MKKNKAFAHHTSTDYIWYRLVSCVRIPPSPYSYKFVGTLSCAQVHLRKVLVSNTR